MSALDLARAELRVLQPYSSARMEARGGSILLNANESAWPPLEGDADINRYPEPQPARLVAALADLYGVKTDQVLVGRGSDEAIDLLVRAFCRAGRDAVLISPPTFGMYAICARIQQAGVIEAPLRTDGALDMDALLGGVSDAVRLVFVCAPNNPTGATVARSEVERLLTELDGRALLVVDEAYVEFADDASVADLIAQHDHLVVLRTLSKAWALAGARVGTLLARTEIVSLLRRIMPPYPVPSPCAQAALRALSPQGQLRMRERVAAIRAERTRMRDMLSTIPCVRAVLPSQANFLCARFTDAGAAYGRLLAAGILVRELRRYSGLEDALRITIGCAEENARVLAVLGECAT
ncbi:MAG TPA: histidinol-phosphate transaminase [Rhodanobacteraceae bacterium]|nr:histidinol-phosphate transaminase [Rhodanobacteraceae bacterium]